LLKIHLEESSEQAGAGELEVPMLEGKQYDVVCQQAEGYEVEDDNKPAPEMRQLLHHPTLVSHMVTDWGFSGICQRRAENLGSESPRL
jgi:hypothetical protein